MLIAAKAIAMKALILTSFLFVLQLNAFAQKHTPLPHGMLFGRKVDSLGVMPAVARKVTLALPAVARFLSITITPLDARTP